MPIIAKIQQPRRRINVGIQSINSPRTTPEIILKNNAAGLATGGATTLGGLTDVNVSGAQDGGVLTYNANTATYTISEIDGGTF